MALVQDRSLDRRRVTSCMLRDYIRACNLDSARAMYGHHTATANMERELLSKVSAEGCLEPSQVEILLTGSTFEGLALPDASAYVGKLYSWQRHHQKAILPDMDFMFVDKAKPIVEGGSGRCQGAGAPVLCGGGLSGSQPLPCGGGLSGSQPLPWARLHYGGTHHGYVRLVPLCDDSVRFAETQRMPHTEHDSSTGRDDTSDPKSFVSSEIFKTRAKMEDYVREVFYAIKSPPDLTTLNEVETELRYSNPYDHGPAVSTTVPSSMLSWETDVDVVLALRVTTWPEVAREWLTRARPHGWPHPDLVADMRLGECHLVPVAHRNSVEPHLEWRLSFSVAEKRLANSLSSLQRQCYLLVKVLYYHELKGIGAIASYHLKTTLFWLCEKTPEAFWREDTFSDCFKLFMDTLIGFLTAGNLPNYFVRANNMIDHVSESTRIDLLRRVEKIKDNPLAFLLPHQATYNMELEERQELIQIAWSKLNFQRYSSRAYYASPVPILNQVFEPIQKELDDAGQVSGAAMLRGRLKLLVALIITKGMNHVWRARGEQATCALAEEIAQDLKRGDGYPLGVGHLATTVVTNLVTSLPVSDKNNVIMDCILFLQYLRDRDSDRLDPESTRIVDRTLASLYAMSDRLRSADGKEFFDERAKTLLGSLGKSCSTAADLINFLNDWPQVGSLDTLEGTWRDKSGILRDPETMTLIVPAVWRHVAAADGGIENMDDLVTAVLKLSAQPHEIIIIDDVLWDPTLVLACHQEARGLKAAASIIALYLVGQALIRAPTPPGDARFTRVLSDMRLEVAKTTRNSFVPTFLLGCLLHDSGRHGDAVEIFKLCLTIRSDHVESNIRLLTCQAVLKTRTGDEHTKLSVRESLEEQPLSGLYCKGLVCSLHALSLKSVGPSKLDRCFHALLQVKAAERLSLLDCLLRDESAAESDPITLLLLICLCRVSMCLANLQSDEDARAALKGQGQRAIWGAASRFHLHPTIVNLVYIKIYLQVGDNESSQVPDLYRQCNVDVPSDGTEELVVFHPCERDWLPEVIQNDCQDSPVLTLPAKMFVSLLIFHRTPLLQLLSLAQDVSGILGAPVGKVAPLGDDVEKETVAQGLLVTGLVLKLTGHIQEARESFQEAVAMFPRWYKNGYDHIRDCENTLQTSSLKKMLKGDLPGALRDYKEVWEAGLPLCRDGCGLGLHLSCQLYDLFLGEEMPQSQCVAFVRYLLLRSGEFIPPDHAQHMWVLLGCMLFRLALRNPEGSEAKKLRADILDTFGRCVTCPDDPSGATLAVYGNVLALLDMKREALVQLEAAIEKGRRCLPLHVVKHKTAVHELVTVTRHFPAHGYLAVDELFELFAASKITKFYDSYLVYSLYLRVVVRSVLGDSCAKAVKEFEEIADEIGYCTAKRSILGLANLHAGEYAKAESWFQAELKDSKNLFEKDHLLHAMIVVCHCLAALAPRLPHVAQGLCEKWLHHLRSVDVKPCCVASHKYVTMTPSTDVNVSSWLALSLSAGSEVATGEDVWLLGEILYYVWQQCRDQERCDLVASQLALLYYQEQYLVLQENTGKETQKEKEKGQEKEKEKYAGMIDELFAYSFKVAEAPAALCQLQYVMFLLQENRPEDGLQQALAAFQYIIHTLQELDDDKHPANPEENKRKKAFYMNKGLDRATMLVARCRCLLGDFSAAAQVFLDSMRLRRKLEGLNSLLASEELCMLMNHVYAFTTDPGTDIDVVIGLCKAIVEHNVAEGVPNQDANYKPTLSCCYGNYACMLFAKVARGAMGEREKSDAYSEIDDLFHKSLQLCPSKLPQRADYGNFLIATGQFAAALATMSVTVEDDEASQAFNAYSVQEKYCVDENIQLEIGADRSGQGFVIHSILYCLYLRVVAGRKLSGAEERSLPEVESDLREMARLCQLAEVFARPESLRLLGYAAVAGGDMELARMAFGKALALMSPDDQLTPHCQSVCDR